jgi:hypothetical protein
VTPVQEALKEGYSQDEINSYLAERSQQALAEGYTPQEVQQYIRENVHQQPEFNKTAIAAPAHDTLAARPSPTTLGEAIETGWGWSTMSLGKSAFSGEGKLPEMDLAQAPWYLRAAGNLATFAGDVPAMVSGFALGGSNPITGTGGALALPMGLRKVFIDAIEQGQAIDKKDFATRALETMWETAKGWVTGAATAGVGGKVADAVANAAIPAAAKTLIPTAAELATLTEVGARLEGHAPEPQSLLDNSILLGVMKAVTPWSYPQPPKVMKDIYVKTGTHPDEVSLDALRGDRGVWQDTLDGAMPKAYQERVEIEPTGQTQAQRTSGITAFHRTTTPFEGEFVKQKNPTGMTFTGQEGFYFSRDKDDPANRVLGNHVIEAQVDIKNPAPVEQLPLGPANFTSPRSVVQVTPEELAAFDEGRGGFVAADSAADVVAGRHRHVPRGEAAREAAAGKLFRLINPEVLSKEDVALLKKRGFDGFDYTKPEGAMNSMPSQVVAFDAKQIKRKDAKGKEGGEKQSMTPEQQAQARAFMEQPFAAVPQMPNEPSRPTHMNYNRIDTPDEAKQTLSRLSEIYEAKILEKRQAPRTWEQSTADAGQVLSDLLGAKPKEVMAFLHGEKGPSATAQLLARKELALGFAEDLMRSRAALKAKGGQATPEEIAAFLAQVERVSNVQSSFLGHRADTARALNALKSTKRIAERSQAIIDAVNSYGGPENVAKLVDMLGEYDSPAQVAKFAKEATKATKWEMVVEAWKAGLVSGLKTHEVNFLSTLAFTVLRLNTEAIAAVQGLARSGPDKVYMSELPARVLGLAKGMVDGFKAAGAVLRTGDNLEAAKTDQKGPAIPGKAGEVIRTPFRMLSAEDTVLKTMNRQAELYAQGVHKALDEGLKFGSDAFFKRAVELATNPTEAMVEAADNAAKRYTFNLPLGPAGQAFQRFVKASHLEMVFPFISTPGNIFKETARMTPGLNLAVKEWREDYAAGGARRDKAMAEVTLGAAIMGAVVLAAMDGTITGNGTPEKGHRATDRAAGWKPYAVKTQVGYVDGYLRMAPIGPLIGLAVDGYEFSKYMTGEERDQWSRMLAFAFAQNVTNQTFFTGAVNLVNVLQDPARYGENYFETLAATAIPQAVGQTAQELDPLLREIHGMREAMLARIPGQREGLLPKRDLFGKPIDNPEHLWFGSPFTVSPISTDKVRTEAARIGFATPTIPKKIDVIPNVRLGNADKVALSDQQRDVFASKSGQYAYEELNKMVHQPSWDTTPDIIKRREFETMFKKARDRAEKELFADIVQHGGNKAAIEKIGKELKK